MKWTHVEIVRNSFANSVTTRFFLRLGYHFLLHLAALTPRCAYKCTATQRLIVLHVTVLEVRMLPEAAQHSHRFYPFFRLDSEASVETRWDDNGTNGIRVR